MRKKAAYEELGYQLCNYRWSWSAENDRGVCIDLWRREIEWTEQRTWFDSRIHGLPLREWGHKLGNTHRKPHLQRARRKFGGVVDVVLLEGVPNTKVRSATPWVPENQNGQRWVVTDADEETGHFRAELGAGRSQGGR